MNNANISIIIPVYKVEKYIDRCLKSILNQTFQDFEIIVVNDASPDNSRSIVEYFAMNDNRIKIFDNEENSGASWSRMMGYSNASGEYITFCDPDDFLPEDALEILYKAMIQDKEADICMGEYQRVFTDGSKSEIFKNELKYGEDKWSVAKSAIRYEIPHFLVNKIYKAELFKNPIITYKNFSKSSDEYLFFQILQYCNKVIKINELVYYYYDNKESASYNKSNFNALNAMMISQKYVENTYKGKEEFKSLIENWKLGKYTKFISVASFEMELLQLVLSENLNHLFTPTNLFKSFHKRKALKTFLTYWKAKFFFIYKNKLNFKSVF